ncbi:MAG: hypothetical protein N2383_06635 [Caldilineales bacterium]|nr:hypothetical protein [Caldilineales bacterium]
MATSDLFDAYLQGLSALLTPPGAPKAGERAGEALRPVSPYSATALAEAEGFLRQSRALQAELYRRWQEAVDAFERSKVEVQLLAAAAADLAVAERLLAAELEAKAPLRSARQSTAGDEDLIRQALQAPETLLTPAALPRRRGAEAELLLEVTYRCLEDVKEKTVKATRDAIEGLLAMPLAVVKEAAEMVGVDLGAKLREVIGQSLQTAVDYILAAIEKLRLLLGPEGEQRIRQAVAEFVARLQDEKAVRQAIADFLATEAIYQQGKTWIKGYQGDTAVLVPLAGQITALQGSFAGRARVADVVVKGLALAKLVPAVWTTMPWGPLAVAAGYLAVVGFILFSAGDHVDSDRFAFFDRVEGVRHVLQKGLGVS